MKQVIVVETKIIENIDMLEELGCLYSFLQRTLFNKLANNKIDKNFRNKLKREYTSKYKIPGRMFNALWSDTKGKLDSLKELHKFNKKQTKNQIKIVEKKIKKTKSNLRRKNIKEHMKVWLNAKLVRLKNKLYKLNIRLEKEFNPSIVFGTRAFYKKQWTDEKYVEYHDLWRQDWKRKRNNHFFFLGSKDENNGNQLCQYIGEESVLRIRLPDCLQTEKVKHINVPVNFSSKMEKKNEQYFNYFHTAYENKQALSYSFLQKENGFWYIEVSFSIYSEPKKAYNGTIGVDINYNLIATTEINRHGNKTKIKNYEYNSEEMSTEQVDDMLSKIVLDIARRAKESNKSISIEKLKLDDCKSSENKERNRKVSLVAYSKFKRKIEVRCCKDSIRLDIVNPAYSSVIGKHKYSKFYGISVHNAAALVLARRAHRFKERIPSQTCFILHSGEASGLFLDTQRYKHNWSCWSLVLKHVKTCFPRKKGIPCRLII